ncbi:unnamed protein product [Strongylus vulgaris]|uniref:Uncharacterized protein n=1 Tax=Strongylus vulgaris TaxID=40348 RepID=A0A3P7J3A2_STRVU|nr:unnamed protein product [Strongylus vulgaris]
MAPAPELASKEFTKVIDQLWKEYFPLSCTVSDGTEKKETTGCLRDHFGDSVKDIVDHGIHGCRNVYKMIMVPGAAEWWIEEFSQSHTTALCRGDEGT